MPSDYALGVERAAHELEWQRRGTEAWLIVYLDAAAAAIRAMPERPHMPYQHAFIDAIFAVRQMCPLIDHSGLVTMVLNKAVRRLAELPIDPLDEPWCRHRDGVLPTTSRGYSAGGSSG